MNILKKAQLAAYCVSILQADLERPNPETMLSVLDMAKSQIRDAVAINIATQPAGRG